MSTHHTFKRGGPLNPLRGWVTLKKRERMLIAVLVALAALALMLQYHYAKQRRPDHYLPRGVEPREHAPG